MKKIIMLFLVVAVFSGCYYDNEQELYGVQDCGPATPSFEQVQGILNTNCITCHNPSLLNGGVNLQSYEAIKKVVDNGMLIGVVAHSPGYSPMPKNGPQLKECDINAIRAWIENGALNL